MVSRSSIEVEFRAHALTMIKVSADFLIRNLIFYSCIKHFDIVFHFRENVVAVKLHMEYTQS